MTETVTRATNRLETTATIAIITLNRPERRNALDTEVFQDLYDALADTEQKRHIRAVILTADGPTFSAGQNLSFTANATIVEKQAYMRVNYETREKIRTLRQPVVARVQGDALGGGGYIATACDLIVAVRNARFAMREIHAGEESGGAHLFTVGRARANEMNLLGRYIDAIEAERWGLINRAVDADELDETVADFVDQLCALPPIGLEYTKRAQNMLLDMAGFRTHMMNRPGDDYLFLTEDAMEARRAFLERRAPNFTGR